MNCNDQEKIKELLDERDDKLESISYEISRLTYQRFFDRKSNPRLSELETERGKLMLDPSFASQLAEWLPRVTEPVLARRLENSKTQLQLGQVAAHPEVLTLKQKLDEMMVGYLYPLGDKRVDITGVRQTVRASADRDLREKAWHSYGELSDKMSEQMIELINLRNRVSSELGYDTYADLMLESGELSLQEAEEMLERIVEQTSQVYDKFIKDGAQKLGLGKIEPWDVQYILESTGGVPDSLFPRNGIIDAVSEWAQKMELNMNELGIHIETADIPYNGLCMGLGRNEIRILGNPADGYSYYRTAFHELGHGIHAVKMKQDYFSLRREGSVFNEAMAEAFGYVPTCERWLTDRGLSSDQARAALQAARGPLFFFLRQRTVLALLEYMLYRGQQDNPDKYLGEIEARVFGCEANSSPRWAANAWYVNYPVYWQNYILADVVTSQIYHHLEETYGHPHHNKEAVDFLLDKYIAPGALIPWRKKVEENTGKPLSVEALVEDINSW